MTKRLLMLDDDEVERVLDWYASAFGIADAASRYVTEDEDEELAEKLRAVRLAP